MGKESSKGFAPLCDFLKCTDALLQFSLVLIDKVRTTKNVNTYDMDATRQHSAYL